MINLARELKRAVRQGDPLSPYLFLLAVETLAIAIRASEEIKGIVINQEETKLLQYADDTTAVLADLESAQKLFQLLDKFKELSGLMVNSSKTEGMWIGSLKNSENKPLGIKWPTEPIKALGVFFTYDHKLSHSKISISAIRNPTNRSQKMLRRQTSLNGLV